MSTDRIVGAQDVLRAIMQLRRQGLVAAVADLESRGADLVEHLLEETTAIHGLLSKTVATAKQVRHIDCRVQSLCVVIVLALRHAYLRLLAPDLQEPDGGTQDSQPPPPMDPEQENCA